MLSAFIKSSFFFLLFLLLLSSCNNAKDPVFEEMQNLQLGKLSLEETSVSADLRFNNPNGFGMKLKRIDCDLFIDETHMGRFNNSEEVKIPAKATFVLPVFGQARTFELLRYSGLALSGKPALVRVKGNARVGRAGIYKTIAVDFTDSIELRF